MKNIKSLYLKAKILAKAFKVKLVVFTRKYKKYSIVVSFIWISGNYAFDKMNFREKEKSYTTSIAKIQKKNDSLLLVSNINRKYIEKIVSGNIQRSKSLDDVEIALWYKVKNEGRYFFVYANRKYEKEYLQGQTRFEMLSKIGVKAFTEPINNIYQLHDSIVDKTGKPTIFIEPFNRNGKQVSLKVLKWRLIDGGYVYIFGAVLEELK